MAQTHFSFCKLCKSFFKGFLCQNQVQNVLKGWNIKSLFGCSLGWINIWGHTSVWVTPWYNVLSFLFEEAKRVHFLSNLRDVIYVGPLNKNNYCISGGEIAETWNRPFTERPSKRRVQTPKRKPRKGSKTKGKTERERAKYQTLQKFHLCNFGPLVLAAQVSPHG